MVKGKVTLELSKDNETRTETKSFEALSEAEWFAQVHTFAKEANAQGFNIDRITSESERDEGPDRG